jgi:uncharacterized protein (DUF362 family)
LEFPLACSAGRHPPALFLIEGNVASVNSYHPSPVPEKPVTKFQFRPSQVARLYVKVKVKVSLCALTEHHATKMYSGVEV